MVSVSLGKSQIPLR